MSNIEQVDKNFILEGKREDGVQYFNAAEGPFRITGFPWFQQNRLFCRLPQDALGNFNENIQRLAGHTAGGVLRFRTNSPFVSIKAVLSSATDMSHMPRSGSSGFDFYIGSGKDRKFVGIAMPQSGSTLCEATVNNPGSGMTEWTIHFPLYNGVKKVELGLQENAQLEAAPPFAIEKPFVFYGSSITQGGCASRPGNSYPNFLSRWFDAAVVNLGFAGNAKGEPAMAHLIAELEMSIFFMDYDHNAPSVEHLESTHEAFFSIVRKAQPDLPIVLITRPGVDKNPEISLQRRDVIDRTYRNALQSGDRNTYFIDGGEFFGKNNRDACTVDGTHPNDLGFLRMAEGIYPTVKAILERG